MQDFTNVDWARLLAGQALDLVCFGAFQVNIHFSGGASLRITCPFRQTPGRGAPPESREFPINSSGLMSLVGKRVVGATSEASYLALAFEGGGLIECFGSSEFESLQIVAGGFEVTA